MMDKMSIQYIKDLQRKHRTLLACAVGCAIIAVCNTAFSVASISTVANKNDEIAALQKIVAACTTGKGGVYSLTHDSEDGKYVVHEEFMCNITGLGTRMERKEQ